MRGKCIMLQGTGSSVGKSLLAAGLCRILSQDGWRVAPFKSQNMALNSFITADGGEMGRAQVMQAEACGIDPTTDMNPVLLKPTSDQGSQVILNGKAIGTMRATEYHAYKPQLREMIRETYDRLETAYDAVVIEGAGSPAEINLREHDIVNMGMAELADAPVILIGDIDRGGVFASLAGTMLLLGEAERARVKGVIINKFRGDVALLEPGLRMLEAIIHVPVLGVMPMMALDVDDEDSVTDRFTRRGEGEVDVAVIRLPRISNFTDFNALSLETGVGVRYVHSAAELGSPDAIILPGSKNTLEDLEAIRRAGLDAAILSHARAGGLVLGICGGYQMLGRWLHDPHAAESALGSVEGLGLLDLEVTFEPDKITSQVSAVLRGVWQDADEMPLEGYEIHMGRNRFGPDAHPFTRILRRGGVALDERDGAANAEGNVMGTYLHGLFDNPAFLRAFANRLRVRRGLAPLAGAPVDVRAHKQAQYDRLAEGMRRHLDMEAVYRILKGEEG